MSIIIQEITKRFGRNLVVDRVNLEILDGELFVLLGASGSGKSTILRIIAGLCPPDSGRVVIHGTDVTRAPAQERGIGFVFQNYSIFSHMTVAENIDFSLRIRSVDRSTRVRRTEELLDMVGLAGMGGRMPRQLSGGQQQRVALARALAHQPKVLLLDEPFGALDVKIRARLRRTLKQVQQKLNVTTILVTHDQDEAFEVGDRIGVLDKGRLLESGHPENLYLKPRGAFVATFLGGGNLLSGRVVQGEAHFGKLHFPEEEIGPREEGQMAHLFFRPEDVRLTEVCPADSLPLLGKGSIIEKRFSGACHRVRVRIPRLPGCRQLAPRPLFGQEDWILEAETRAESPLKDIDYWVSLKRWVFLTPPKPHILLFDNEASEGTGHLDLARWLSPRVDGNVTILRNRKDHETDEKVRQRLQERLTEAQVAVSDILLPQGKSGEVLVQEQATGAYSFIVLARGKGHPELSHLGITRMLTRVLDGSEAPLLVASKDFRPVKTMLLCTAAGEPGKSDVRLGAWLARRIGARVILLHILTPRANSTTARGHVANAAATIASLDIEVETRLIEDPSPVEAILREAESADVDLVVLGGHGRYSHTLFEPEDVTLQVLRRLDRSALVVPAQEKIS